MKPSAVRCATCNYWLQIRKDGPGECRRRAPVLHLEGDLGGFWPQTGADDFCGEWGGLLWATEKQRKPARDPWWMRLAMGRGW